MDMDTAARGESFITCQTFKWFVLQVDSLVCRQVTVLGELLPALCTPELVVSFLTGQSMPWEAAPCRQCLTTGRACERPFAMPPAGHLMCPEVAAGAKHLLAVRTPVGPLLVVHGELVDSDAAPGGESFPTGGAGKGPLSAVDPQVSTQVGPSGEAAAADAAAEGLFAAR